MPGKGYESHEVRAEVNRNEGVRGQSDLRYGVRVQIYLFRGKGIPAKQISA